MASFMSDSGAGRLLTILGLGIQGLDGFVDGLPHLPELERLGNEIESAFG